MFFGRQNRAINTEVSRRARGGHVGRGLIALSVAAAFLAMSQVASAIPVMSLRFASQTIFADGINPTPVTVLVQVVNGGTAFPVNSLSTEYSVSASGTLNASLLTLASGTVSSPGVFVNGAPNFTINGTNGWGIDTNGATSTVATATTSVATLVFTVPAGVTSGAYTINFLTDPLGDPFRSFANTNTSAEYPYANGNNGSTFGVITVIPEPSTEAGLAAGAVLFTGVGFVQRRMRRRSRSAAGFAG